MIKVENKKYSIAQIKSILKNKYYILRKIKEGYKFYYKNTIIKTDLAYDISKTRPSSAQLIVLSQNKFKIKEIFEMSYFTCIVQIKNNTTNVFVRKKIEQYEKINFWPSPYTLFWVDIKNYFLYMFKAIYKAIELRLINLSCVILKIIFPTLGNKIYHYYYDDPLKHAVCKYDYYRMQEMHNLK